VVVPFIEVPTVGSSSPNGPAAAPLPFKGFKPYVYQALARYNLPDKDSFTWEIGGAIWFGNAKNVNDYFGSSTLNPLVTSSTAGEVDFGGDYALVNEFQLGAHLEGMRMPSSTSSWNGLNGGSVQMSSNAVGGALAAKYLIAFDKAFSLVLHLEGGYYTLVSSDFSYNDGHNGTVDLSGSAMGGLAAVELEMFQVEDKSIALDLGLGYRMLKFTGVTTSGTVTNLNNISSNAPTTNVDGSPAYVDYSGPRISLSLRFIH
jgi:hypothetical protein